MLGQVCDCKTNALPPRPMCSAPKALGRLSKLVQVQELLGLHAAPALHRIQYQPFLHRSSTRPVRLVHQCFPAERDRDFGAVTLCPTLPFLSRPMAGLSRCASCRPRRRSRPQADPQPRASTGRGPSTRHSGVPRVGTGNPRSTSSTRGPEGRAARSLRALSFSARDQPASREAAGLG